ncbi:hypothetical protein ymoll0001_5870 [Yersinia mollaretii ATCC 43969]|uniref:Uncharacterized protein n=1 Tax=Yersinia mollaretii (strain ATCC 43969 / DSM 18520 / CIP 103324 / CNY 7263 / WAIP 204) TaxID=349967 RepID=A0ABM9Y4H5_YERMW|nr:hypothetical protein ymoll0001_5870 [Yersinia mollaretii ATCC 43969]
MYPNFASTRRSAAMPTTIQLTLFMSGQPLPRFSRTYR